MRNGVKQLARALSLAAVVLLCAARTSHAAGRLGSYGGDYGRTFNPGRAIANAVGHWAGVTFGDEMIVPRP